MGYSAWSGVTKSGTQTEVTWHTHDSWLCAVGKKYRCKVKSLIKASTGLNQLKSLE